MQAITLALTNYNRTDLLMQSFRKVWHDERIDEIVIVDDCSNQQTTNFLLENLFGKEKITLYLNDENIGMARNKAKAISLSKNDWVIIFDSDNVMDSNYLDALFKQEFEDNTIYAPDFARPNFNYSEFAGHTINRQNIRRWAKQKQFETVFNTCNYVVNKHKYAEVFQHNPDMKGTDTAWFNYCWIASRKQFKVVRNMQYDHRVHDDSEFLKEIEYNMAKSAELRQMMMAL